MLVINNSQGPKEGGAESFESAQKFRWNSSDRNGKCSSSPRAMPSKAEATELVFVRFKTRRTVKILKLL